MKKIKELLKPFIFIIFGALLFLYYFNGLSSEGAGLAISIIAIILAAYFLAVGILSVVLGDKLGKAKGLLNLIGVATFPLFLGVVELITLINLADIEGYLGPTGWTISIVTIATAFGLGALLFVSYFVRSKGLHRVTFLFGAIFVLALLLDVLLLVDGSPATIGQVVILQVVLYACYVSMLFEVLASFKENKEPKKVEEAKEEKPAEEEPKEEAQAE